MTRLDEETRATLYQSNLVARIATERARESALAGDGASAQAVRDGWEPVVLALAETRADRAGAGTDILEEWTQ